MRSKWLTKKHECRHPVTGSRGVGSIWQCKCGIQWEVKAKRIVGAYEHVKWGRA